MTDDRSSETTEATESDDADTTTSNEDTVGPELTQEDLDRAGEKMDGLNDRYKTGGRETVTLPGTNGTVSGTAFADFDPEKADSDDESSSKDDAEASAE
jgi:hypothetical protein